MLLSQLGADGGLATLFCLTGRNVARYLVSCILYTFTRPPGSPQAGLHDSYNIDTYMSLLSVLLSFPMLPPRLHD
jgi:hypothetical protein